MERLTLSIMHIRHLSSRDGGLRRAHAPIPEWQWPIAAADFVPGLEIAMRLLCEQRLRLMTGRQSIPAWGKDYQPSIRATPREAPRISRPAILRAQKIGRDLHLLSSPEVSAAVLALHCPSVYDIHEQRLLSTAPDCHPLQGSPEGTGLVLRPMRGTVQVAEALGVLPRHPKLFLQLDEGDGAWVPFPYTGDLLLFMKDARGAYCVNWNVKLAQEDYSRPGPRLSGRRRRQLPDESAELRHKIEEAYYADGEIRTVRVTKAEIDSGLIANLLALFGWHAQSVVASSEMRAHAVEMYRESIGGSEKAFRIAQKVSEKTGISLHEAKVILYQAIWTRQLLVDLFTPLLIDQPLAPQRRDPVDVYGAWFRR